MCHLATWVILSWRQTRSSNRRRFYFSLNCLKVERGTVLRTVITNFIRLNLQCRTNICLPNACLLSLQFCVPSSEAPDSCPFPYLKIGTSLTAWLPLPSYLVGFLYVIKFIFLPLICLYCGRVSAKNLENYFSLPSSEHMQSFFL